MKGQDSVPSLKQLKVYASLSIEAQDKYIESLQIHKYDIEALHKLEIRSLLIRAPAFEKKLNKIVTQRRFYSNCKKPNISLQQSEEQNNETMKATNDISQSCNETKKTTNSKEYIQDEAQTAPNNREQNRMYNSLADRSELPDLQLKTQKPSSSKSGFLSHFVDYMSTCLKLPSMRHQRETVQNERKLTQRPKTEEEQQLLAQSQEQQASGSTTLAEKRLKSE